MNTLEDYEHYGVLQYRTRPGGKWRCFRAQNGTPDGIGWNGRSDQHVPEFMRDYVRLATNEDLAAEREESGKRSAGSNQ